jgi:DNA primase
MAETSNHKNADGLRQLAMAGAGALRSGHQWQAFLRRAERFADAGFVNTMLIWAQCPDAVLVHDYAEWKRLGRRVIRGEHGIRLVTGSGNVATAFDLLQTTGKPQPVRIRNENGGRGVRPGTWKALGSVVEEHRGTDEMAVALDLARRLARRLLGGAAAWMGEPESVAFMLALRLGLDTTGFAFPDIGRWAGADPRSPMSAIVAAVGERVLSAAAKAFASWDGDAGSPALLVSGPRLAAQDRPERAVADLFPYGEAVRMLAHADRYFAGQVRGSWVPGYLVSRGFSEAVQERWGAGYAPAGWTALTEHLRGLGYDDQAIEECGLAKRSAQGRVIDVFRDRLMFPVRSVSGSVIGFVGRAGPDVGKDTPKYLNSRASRLYSKGRVLFGLNESRDALASGACPVIVEGPLDAIAVTSAGDGRYVGLAPCGTALTADHVALLSKAANLAEIGLRVAFDGDKAGQAAAVRA